MLPIGEGTPPPPLSMEELDQVSTEREDLYICKYPEGLWYPLLVRPTEIEDGIPSDAEIVVADWGMK